MLQEIGKLREIARMCRDGEALAAEQAAWLSGGIERFLAHESPTMEAAFGLRFARGGIPWWKEEAIRQRDAALRDLAALLSPDDCLTRRAGTVHSQSLRYGGSTWRFDRDRDAMPESYEGTAKQYLWRAFRSGAAMPVSERQLRNILRV